MRIRIDANARMNIIFTDNAGIPFNAGPVQVEVKRDNESVLETNAIYNNATYAYSFEFLPTELGWYDIYWTSTDTGAEEKSEVEVVGEDFFSLGELRQALMYRDYKGTYDNGYLTRLRDEVAAEFESVSGRSFVPRRRTALVRVYGGEAVLPSVDVSGVELVNGGEFTGTWYFDGLVSGLPDGQAQVTYVYGFSVAPEDVRRAAIARAAGLVIRDKSGHPENAESFSSVDGGTYRLIVPGRGQYSIGVPAIDVVLNRYKIELSRGVA